MLGIFVFGASNELLYAYGNSDMWSRIFKSCSRMALMSCGDSSSLCASTSSGVYSDGSCVEQEQLLSKDDNSEPAKLNQIASLIHSESCRYMLADSFLPLLSIYRTSADVFGDAQQFIESTHFRISFRPLADSSLIVCISELDSKFLRRQQQLIDAIECLIDFHHGPLLAHPKFTVNATQNLSRRFDSSIVLMLNAFNATKYSQFTSTIRHRFNELNVTARIMAAAAAAAGNGVEKNLWHLQILSQQLSAMMGASISCLLFVDGNFMGYTHAGANNNNHNNNSDERKNNLRSLAEIVNFFDLTNTHADAKNTARSQPDVDLSQVWLSNGGDARFLSNIFTMQCSNDMSILCVTRADYSISLDSFKVLLTKLNANYLLLNNNTCESIRTVDEQIDRCCKALSEISMDNRDDVSHSYDMSAFLRNVNRTSHFIKNLWREIRELLIGAIDEHKRSAYTSSSSSMQQARNKFSSKVWPLKFTSKVTQNGEGRRNREKAIGKGGGGGGGSYKLDSMLAYFKHQLRTITMEIAMKSLHNAKNFQLPYLSDKMRKFFTKFIIYNHPTTATTPTTTNSILYRPQMANIHPSRNGLDMIAYSFVMINHNLRLTFIPEEYSFMHELIEIESIADSNQSMKLYFITMHQSTYLIVTIKTSNNTMQTTNGKQTTRNRLCAAAIPLFSSLFTSKRRLSKRSSSSSGIIDDERFQCTTIFDSYVNKQLAIRQTWALVDSLRQTIRHNSHYIIIIP